MPEIAYRGAIPDEMNADRLNALYFDVFGVDTFDLYLCRDIFNAASILITDFPASSTDGAFFWAQLEHESVKIRK